MYFQIRIVEDGVLWPVVCLAAIVPPDFVSVVACGGAVVAVQHMLRVAVRDSVVGVAICD